MRLPNATGETCKETTGFLFHHACNNPATSKCDECQKLTCEQHTVVEGASTYCTTCAKRLAQSTGGAAAGGAPTRLNPRFTIRRGYYNDYDPYWYSTSYYNGYGFYGPGYWGHSYMSEPGFAGSPQRAPNDPSDFTAADTSSVQAEGDANFENEIGGS